jgi:hypothetical protein
MVSLIVKQLVLVLVAEVTSYAVQQLFKAYQNYRDGDTEDW